MTIDNCHWGCSQIWAVSSCTISQDFPSKKKSREAWKWLVCSEVHFIKRELKACKNHRINFLAHYGTFTAIWTQMIKTQFWLTFPKWNPTICTCDLGKQRRKVGIFLTLYISSILDILIVQVKGWIKLFFDYTHCQSYQGQQFKSVHFQRVAH